LNNALKYSDGDLEITLSNTGEIVFTNTASKLDEVEVSRLFDRFYSVESVRNSTGLGLSIAKLLTRQLDGTINARYSEGRLAIVLRF
jgi:signal transduction histidine kinase